MKRNPIYVELPMHVELSDLWEYTQNPAVHQEWDLRFSEIRYLPKENEADPQKFLYGTRIGFGLRISGEGESIGTHDKANGERTSALKFWSDEPISLIKFGSGYWKYIPFDESVRFLTWYDYDTRFGLLGQIFDKVIFRPLLGWATAWSFDRLRLWLEKGIHPATSLRHSIIQVVTQLTLAFIWIYQGLVPKLLAKSSGELEILRGSGLFSGYEELVLAGIGIVEILFGLLFVIARGNRRIHVVNIAALIVLTVAALFSQPLLFIAPFNPVTLNIAMIGLSIVALNNSTDLPNAGNCVRKQESA